MSETNHTSGGPNGSDDQPSETAAFGSLQISHTDSEITCAVRSYDDDPYAVGLTLKMTNSSLQIEMKRDYAIQLANKITQAARDAETSDCS